MYRHFFKRVLDIVCALLALTVFSPLFLALMIIGAIEMKGNPFFTQERPGYKEKIFKLIKFRTMTNEKDENGNLLPDEDRLNKYGKFLRSTSLDELPEAINILIGHMSVIDRYRFLSNICRCITQNSIEDMMLSLVCPVKHKLTEKYRIWEDNLRWMLIRRPCFIPLDGRSF